MRKKIIPAMVIALLCIAEVGCGMDVLKLKVEDYKLNAQNAKEYIEEKYGEEFVIEGYEYSDYLSTTDEVFIYSNEMDPDLQERAHIYVIKDDGGVHFGDDYFAFLIRPQLEAYMQESLQTVFSDVKVLFHPEHRRINDALTGDSSLEDFFTTDQRYRIKANLYIKYEPGMTRDSFVQKVEQVMDTFAKKHDTWFFKVYVVPEGIYDSMDPKTESEFLEESVKKWDPDGETYYTEDSVRIEKGEVSVDWSKAKHCLD